MKKDENEQKEAGIGPFKKDLFPFQQSKKDPIKAEYLSMQYERF